MAETTIVQARGLYLGPSDPQTPPGAMSEATNVVISRDGIVETRRGLDIVGTKAVTRVWPYGGSLVGHGTTTLSRSSDGATWTDYSTALAPPSDAVIRAMEAQGCLFLTTSDGPYRMDSLTAEPIRSGVPEALDLGLALSTAAGTAVPTGNMIGYRILFATKDDSGRLILGGPSSRAVISNGSGSTKDITVSGTIPDGINSTDHFVQVYRTRKSGGASTDPGDEMGLVYEGAIPAVRTGTQLVRTGGTTVTATTSADHGYSVGMQVRISPGGTVAASAVAIGSSSAIQRSTDNGVTWSSAGITGLPAGSYYGICNGRGLYVAVGDNVAATSSDGLTWTSRTLSPAGVYHAVVDTGTRYVAVGDSGKISYSTDGTSWNSAAVSSLYMWRGLGWNGNQLLAVGYNGTGPADPVSGSSSDGITWTLNAAPSGLNGGTSMEVAYEPLNSRWLVAGTTYAGNRWAAYSAYPNATGAFAAASGVSGAGSITGISNSGSSIILVGPAAYKSTDYGKTYSTITWSSGTLNAVTWDGSNFIAAGTNAAATGSANPSSLTSRTITAGTYNAVALGGSVDFPAGEYAITAVPLATTFEYAQAGTNGTLTASQTITPLTFAVSDSAPDGVFGAALYTNANQDGILSANSRPLYARELATFNGSLFLGHVNTPAQTIVSLLGTSGANGLVANDTITVNGIVYTAKASESITNREFAVVTSGGASDNIRDTAASLVRVINRSPSSPVYSQDASDPSGFPGLISIWCRDSAATLTIDVSRDSAWANASSVSLAPKEWKNGIVWSKTDQPDHFPKSLALIPQQVGSGSAEILRLAATRSSLFIFKEDGLWRLTGDAGLWDIQPFDPTVRLVAPESVAVLDNSVFALCEAGVLRVSDTGVSLVSRQPGACDIQPIIEDLTVPATIDSLAEVAFGVAYESDHKYLLGVPAPFYEFLVYDAYTRAWTTWDLNPTHGCVLGNRLWLVGESNQIRKESKTGTYADYQDQNGSVTVTAGAGTTTITVASTSGMFAGDAVGTFIIRAVASGTQLTMWESVPLNTTYSYYRAIPVAVRWTPSLGVSPAVLTKVRELRLLFDWIAFWTATADISNTYTRSALDSIAMVGTEQGLSIAPTNNEQASIRFWPSIDNSVGSGIAVGFSHRQASRPCAISGLSITHEPMSGRTNR